MSHEKDLESKGRKLTVLQGEYKNCTKCELHETRNNVVFGIGNPDADIIIVAEAPGETEDISGYPLVGPSGQILDYLLAKTSEDSELNRLAKSFPGKKMDKFGWTWPDFEEAKMALMKEVFYTNTVLCRPPENRNPYLKEIKACNDRLNETIYTIDPVIIIAAGKPSIETLLGKKVSSIQKICGRLVDITFHGKMIDITYPVMPILHPAFLMRNPDMGKKEGVWESTTRALTTARKIVEESRRIG